MRSFEYRSKGIHSTDNTFEVVYLVFRDEITLIQNNEVCKFELIERDFRMGYKEIFIIQCIDEADDRIELYSSSHIIHEK